MLKINQSELKKNEKYIVGVSGGPDSMCLLDVLIKQGFNLVVCNVNYNTRDVSLKEQLMVEDYCKKNNVIFESMSCSHNEDDKNFEGWAREKRYSFFKDIYCKYNASGLFIAHHRNDNIETYILQKNRNNYVKCWGLSPKTTILGMNVLRPFLSYSKEEIVSYCDENNIPYSIDVTNLEPICERNRVRIAMKDYSDNEINELLTNIEKDNKELNECMKKLEPLLEKNEWHVDEVKTLSQTERIRFIYEIITKVCPSLSNKMSKGRIEEINKALFARKSNLYIDIIDGVSICKSYGFFRIISLQKEEDYMMVINEPGSYENEYFSVVIPEDASFLKITKESYPLTIRKARKDDVVTFGNVHKKVNRVMIDEKIPLFRRNNYPIILDKNQKVVYFPLYTSDKQKSIAYRMSFVLK